MLIAPSCRCECPPHRLVIVQSRATLLATSFPVEGAARLLAPLVHVVRVCISASLLVTVTAHCQPCRTGMRGGLHRHLSQVEGL